MDLMERDFHLDALDGYLRQAAGGGGNMVLIGGEAGAGKTSLIQCFARRAQEMPARILIGACDAMSTPRPLGPLFDVASDLGRSVRQLLGDHERRAELFGAMLESLTVGGPALFVIEDAHWADEATLDLLRFLGRRIEGTRALLAVTYRDDEVTSRHRLQLVLGDLATRKSVRRLKIDLLSEHAVRILADGAGIDAIELYHKTDGNPFYVTEVIGAGTGAIPPTVRDAVLARYALLSPGGRAVLDAAAVIGGRIEPWLLAEVDGKSADAVDECLDCGLLQARDSVIQFRHQLARDAVVDAISLVKRMELHASVLTALRQRVTTVGDFTRLAHHAEGAGDAEAVLAYAPTAGDRASALSSHREATAQYARALRFAGGLPAQRRLQLLETYADVSDLAFQGAPGIGPRQEIIALARRAGDRPKEAEHLGWLAVALSVAGRNSDAEQALCAALAALEGTPEGPAHAKVYRQHAEIRLGNRSLIEAVTWGERAIALAERLGDAPTLILGLNALGGARLIGGDLEQGRADLERSLHLAREAGDDLSVVGAMADLGSGHAEIFRLDEADRRLTEAIAYATERDLHGAQHDWAVAWLAQTRLFQGRWTEATNLAAFALRIPTASIFTVNTIAPSVVPSSFEIPPEIRVAALIALGRVRARRGDPEVAVVLDEALKLSPSTGPLYFFIPLHAARAEAAWLIGDRARTQVESRAAFELAVRRGLTWHIGELGYWRWKAGDLPELPKDAAEPYALQMSGNWAEAAAAWTALGCPYEAARAQAEGNDEDSLREAFATFDRLGARPATAMVARRLREQGAKSVPRGARSATRANAGHLTSREFEVLALIAEDSTNAEIAARLYLSPKTIEHHVSSILLKLDVRSRRDAVRKSSELNLLDQYKGHQSPN